MPVNMGRRNDRTGHHHPAKSTSKKRSALLFLLLTLACATHTGAPSTYYPAAEWERVASPEAAGYTTTGLAVARAELEKIQTTGFMAVVGGKVLLEYGDVTQLSYLASVRKSILSMLYGIHIARGEIDLSKTLAQLNIDDNQGLTAAEKQATVRDLLMARSGIYHPASNAGDDTQFAPPRGSQKPGAYYLYNNWDFNALGTIFEQETGKNIYDALRDDIAGPIGMQDFRREAQNKSGNAQTSRHLAYHFTLSTRDMARIGYLMLRDGKWRGQQIVPSAWVKESTAALTPRTDMNPPNRRTGRFGYGYLWWRFDGPQPSPAYEGAYSGQGAFGQYILVMPKLDLVVAHKTAVPPNDRQVSTAQFLRVVDALIAARQQ